MQTSSDPDVVGRACGLIAARLEVEPETAATILARVAQREGLSTDELAAEVVASYASSDASLQRDLVTNDHGHEPAA